MQLMALNDMTQNTINEVADRFTIVQERVKAWEEKVGMDEESVGNIKEPIADMSVDNEELKKKQ